MTIRNSLPENETTTNHRDIPATKKHPHTGQIALLRQAMAAKRQAENEAEGESATKKAKLSMAKG